MVGDNRSKDKTPLVVKEFEKRDWNLRYFYEKRQGLSFVRNSGFHLAKAEWVAYIDDDSIAAKEWVQKLISIIRTQKKAVIIGGQTFPIYKEGAPAWLTGSSFFTCSKGARKRYLKSESAPHAINGSNMTIKKICLEQVGGFRTDLGMKGRKIGFGEDPECCMRIYKLWPFIYYDPAIVVYDCIQPEKYSFLYILKYRFITAKMYFHFAGNVMGYSYIIKKIFRSILKLRSILALLLSLRGALTPKQAKQLIHYSEECSQNIGLLRKRILYSFR